ncbi:transcription termination/antitermination protein NusA [Candidatus Parcubacteria bacterium]|nr:MAG: transcription termination/antitermination protein NusA [Candidatus Parcubacteria bacterium]
MNLKELSRAVEQIAEEKGLKPEVVLETVEHAIAAAYKKEYGRRGEIIRAKLDPETGEVKFWQVKLVVDPTEVRIEDEAEEENTPAQKGKELAQKESRAKETRAGAESQQGEEEKKLPRFHPERHIFLEEARKIKPDAQVGDELIFPLEPKEDFGRIAAQAAKQVILQKLRESERQSILEEWRDKEGQIVSGVVQRFERGHVYVDLGRTVGVMFANESVPGEHYRTGERLRFLVLAVQEETRTPGIVLSRSHPDFVAKLFEMEVPELADGVCEIKAIAREPGSRTKIAVASYEEGVDPVGACVGQRGTRVMAVNNELGQEKIDIVEWVEDPAQFVANALSPAKVTSVEVLPRREARVYVPEDQLSLAIGRGGQNVRLAAKLTGWKIDVRSQTRPEEVQEGGIAEARSESVPEEEEQAAEQNAQETGGEEEHGGTEAEDVSTASATEEKVQENALQEAPGDKK